MKEILSALIVAILLSCSRGSGKELANVSDVLKGSSQKTFLSLSEKENYSQDIKTISEKLKEKPKTDLYKTRGLIYYRFHNYKKSRRDLEKALKENPADLIVLYVLAHLYYYIGEDYKAYSCFQDFNNIIPKKKFKLNKGIEKTIKIMAANQVLVMLQIDKNEEREKNINKGLNKYVNAKKDEKCMYLNHYAKEKESFKWTGKCKDEYAEGKGTLVYDWYDENIEYKGILGKGVFKGVVEAINKKNNYKRECVFVNGLCEGKGKSEVKNHYVFEGTFQHGFMHGNGRILNDDGTKYEGTFVKDRPMENGKAYCSDGKETEFFIMRSFNTGAWSIVFNCGK